jgi:hypothetical protein
MKKIVENYTLRRPAPESYVDDLFVWGGRVLGVMMIAACVLYIVEGI